MSNRVTLCVSFSWFLSITCVTTRPSWRQPFRQFLFAFSVCLHFAFWTPLSPWAAGLHLDIKHCMLAVFNTHKGQPPRVMLLQREGSVYPTCPGTVGGAGTLKKTKRLTPVYLLRPVGSCQFTVPPLLELINCTELLMFSFSRHCWRNCLFYLTVVGGTFPPLMEWAAHLQDVVAVHIGSCNYQWSQHEGHTQVCAPAPGAGLATNRQSHLDILQQRRRRR